MQFNLNMPKNTRILVLKDKTVVPLDSDSGSLRYSSTVLFFPFPVVLCSCECSKCGNTKAYYVNFVAICYCSKTKTKI